MVNFPLVLGLLSTQMLFVIVLNREPLATKT